jgi:hypothetical protein
VGLSDTVGRPRALGRMHLPDMDLRVDNGAARGLRFGSFGL